MYDDWSVAEAHAHADEVWESVFRHEREEKKRAAKRKLEEEKEARRRARLLALSGSDYDKRRFRRWVLADRPNLILDYGITRIALVDGKGPHRTFLAKCKGHVRFFEVYLNRPWRGIRATYPYDKSDKTHKAKLKASGL